MMVSEVGRTTRGSSSFSPPPMGDHRQLGREALHVFLLLLEEGHGDEDGEGRVDVTGLLEAAVERGGHVFPQRPAVRSHDHAAAHGGVIGQLGLEHELVVPFGEVLSAGGKFIVSHFYSTRK